MNSRDNNYWLRLAARRLSRRRLLRGAAAGGLGLAAAAAIGCGEEEAAPTATRTPSTGTGTPSTGATTGTPAPSAIKHNRGYTADEVSRMTLEEFREAFHGKYLREVWGGKQPKYGGVLKQSGSAPITWDLTKPAGTLLASYAMHWNQLVDFDIGDFAENPNIHKLTPDLAQSIEQVDPLTIVFKLHENVYFHDLPPVNGRQMTAEDVKYVTETYMTSPGQQGTYVDVDSVEAVDANTVRFKFKEPAAYWLGMMTQPYHFIFAREQLEAGTMDRMPIGTGAFVWESSEVNSHHYINKHPKYFKKDPHTGMQLPYLDRYEGTFFGDIAAQTAAFRTKQIDRLPSPTPELFLEVLKTNADVVIQVTTPPNSYQPHMGMNLSKAPFNDVRVRRALSMAIDRDLIIQTINKNWAAYGAPLSWDFFGQEWPWTPEQMGENFQYNPEKAKQLMKEAGYENGFQAEFLTYSLVQAQYGANMQAVHDMWRRHLNVEVTIDQKPDSAAYFDLFYNAKYKDFAGNGVLGPAVEPHAYVWDATHSTSPKNYYYIKDDKNDELALKQRRELDPEKRKQILMEWFNYDNSQVTRIWITNVYRVALRHPYLYNSADEINAWEPGWGSKVREKVWKDV